MPILQLIKLVGTPFRSSIKAPTYSPKDMLSRCVAGQAWQCSSGNTR